MKHLSALLIKFVVFAVILELYLLPATNLDFFRILLLSAAVTVIAYFIGDIVIMPRAGNMTATLINLTIAFFTVFSFGYIKGFESITITDSIVCSVLIGVSEWFFHKYLARKSRGRTAH